LLREGGSVSKRGASPLSKISSPSPLKERGIKGVRWISNLDIASQAKVNFLICLRLLWI
jgi:hypothetical protein